MENLCEYICFEEFDFVKRIPKLLNCCSKIICMDCLEKISQVNKGKIKCPICRKIIQLQPKELRTPKYIKSYNNENVNNLNIFKDQFTKRIIAIEGKFFI
jgi:hypothetical protein